MLICAFLVSHMMDKNANLELTNLKKIENHDFFSSESISITKVLAAKVFNEQLNLFCLSKMNYTKHKSFYKILLLLSGDISLNPGPTKYPCTICDRGVRKGVYCTNCKMWVHQKCENISNIEYRRLSKIPDAIYMYTCRNCAVSDFLPFHDVSFEEPINITNDPINTSELNPDKDMWSPFKKRGLHFLHININSILSKIEELRHIAKLSNASVIGVSESKLDDSVFDNEVSIEGYKLLRADRTRNGGGVACYIKSELGYNFRKDFSTDIENIFFDILLPNSKPILVGIIYRPPDQSGFLGKLTEAIKTTQKFDEQEVYILGDFNINLLSKETLCIRKPKYYTEFCSLHGLRQLLNSPTRITESTSTLLDHILTNSVSQSGILDIGLSDHMLTYCTRKITHKKHFEHKYIRIRYLKNYSQEGFTQSLEEANFPDYSNFNSVNEAYDNFVAKLTAIIDEVAPIKRIRVKGNTQEWFDDEIHCAIKNRDQYFSAFKRSKSKADKLSYKQAQNRVQNLIKKKKRQFVKGKLENNTGKPKELWKTLKSLGFSKTEVSASKTCLESEGNLTPKRTLKFLKTFSQN